MEISLAQLVDLQIQAEHEKALTLTEASGNESIIKVCTIQDVKDCVNIEDDWLADVAPNGGFCDPNESSCESCQ